MSPCEEKWVLRRAFDGAPDPARDFELVATPFADADAVKEGEIEFECEFLSVDPYQRLFSDRVQVPATMIGRQVARVTRSRDPEYPVGCRVLLNVGWVRRGRVVPAQIVKQAPGFADNIRPAPVLDGIGPSQLLGVCGRPGNSAYFGLLDICKPKGGETVVVTGAAGAVGSLVGQIARIVGCRVVGFAGSDEKVRWIKEDLGFHHAFNYKKVGVLEALSESAPDGVDCYFDNVGGEMSSQILSRMRHGGRVSCCGAISTYNDEREAPAKATPLQTYIVTKELKLEGFIVSRWFPRWSEGLEQMAKWVREGKIKVRETVVDGFDKAPEAFAGLFTGDNFGKMVVKA